uniref:Uncharacterized protein n=2 Tax=Hemiselmis andersenii TaxID=464988 RepID=A0A6U4NHQ4_HEMAN|mmetsp:Transcript_10289/g.25032  ORF Transcript_10289/g.25032 Transcript_10289/m.25032 type:complete len:276 (+) Transcript_10289:104-931(+)
MSVPGQGGGGRRPPDDDDGDGPGVLRGALTWTDILWCLVHAGLLVLDVQVLWELSGARSPRAAHRFGGHTQFVATWSLAISSASHLSLLYSTLWLEPYPVVYHHPTRVKRDRAYEWTARVSALATTFCPAAAMLHILLHYYLGERESWTLGGAFPYAYTDVIVPLDKLVALALQKPRHWAFGPARYVTRRSELLTGTLTVGQSGVHRALMAYCCWMAVCRLASGRWAYKALSEAEAASGTWLGFLAHCTALLSVAQGGAWGVWRLAAAVAQTPSP